MKREPCKLCGKVQPYQSLGRYTQTDTGVEPGVYHTACYNEEATEIASPGYRSRKAQSEIADRIARMFLSK